MRGRSGGQGVGPIGQAASASVTMVARERIDPLASLRGVLRRPLASYYLLLGSAALLLGLGLVMVLSASSIASYIYSGSAFTLFVKQLTWALIGVPIFFIALRLP